MLCALQACIACVHAMCIPMMKVALNCAQLKGSRLVCDRNSRQLCVVCQCWMWSSAVEGELPHAQHVWLPADLGVDFFPESDFPMYCDLAGGFPKCCTKPDVSLPIL